ncbi:hypothetical protein MP638_003057, partial [Amoeboaphelidium occidentale]
MYDYSNEYVRFFYENSKIKVYHANYCATCLTGSEVERIGLELGDTFFGLEDEIYHSGDKISVEELYESVLELREENPELAKTLYWHLFEDYLFTQYHISGVRLWLDILDFACSHKYILFKKDVVEHFTYTLFDNIIDGSIDCGKIAQVLGYLFLLLENFQKF